MTRPTIIRADTLDLQDPVAPSAKDHPSHPHFFGPASDAAGPTIAPHQAETLREIAQETAEAEARSPRVSWTNGPVNEAEDLVQQYVRDKPGQVSRSDKDIEGGSRIDMLQHEQQDALAIAQNGGISSTSEEELDGEDEADLDDDMMDKISSSPSIEDAFAARQFALKAYRFGICGHGQALYVYIDGVNHAEQCSHPHEGHFQEDGRSPCPGFATSMPYITFPKKLKLYAVGESLEQQVYTSDPSPQGDMTIAHDGDGECLLVSEDIDFEFVYALHTFVATVEGQANASKGDTMVLLDDSNSYWWLVRVVKDNSIGYLPAEHIETPTERLARLNKHRNIDLSAAMLGDQAVKQKNSFKSMRRRKKTVAFTEPTYVDYSDFEYSTDDDEIEELFGSQPAGQHHQREQHRQQEQQEQNRVSNSGEGVAADESAKVEPLKTRAHTDLKAAAQSANDSHDQEGTRRSDESVEDSTNGPSRSRNGTVRNTDSFFKDDTVETKKITLTPNLLRDDNTSRQSSESTTKDTRSGSSLDKIDRDLTSDKEKRKLKDKDKKDKDKKSGGLRGFFSRKDKKKNADEDDDSPGKGSLDIVEARDSEDRSGEEQQSSDKPLLQKQPSKLQKAGAATKLSASNAPQSVELSSYLSENRTNDVSNVPPASMRIVDADPKEASVFPYAQIASRDGARDRSSPTGHGNDESLVNSRLVPPRGSSTGPDTKSSTPSKAKTQATSDASSAPEARYNTTVQQGAAGHRDGEYEQKEKADDRVSGWRSAEIGQHAAPSGPSDSLHTEQSLARGARMANGETFPAQAPIHPPALVVDSSSPESVSPEVSPSPEPLQVSIDAGRGGAAASTTKDAIWDDTKLHAFFDESDHIRDFLVVVYDKTNVEPAGVDHPVVGGLFREQNAKLAEITTQLDNMLGDWLARKQRLRGTI